MNTRRIARLFQAGLVATLAGACLVVAPPASAGTWANLPGDDGGACYSGGVSGFSRYTWCWGKRRLQNDGSGTRDYYAFRMTLSGSSVGAKMMKKAWVEPQPRAGTTTQRWSGTDPFSPDHTVSRDVNCVQVSSSVGGGEIPLTFGTTQTTCGKERFGPKLYSSAGHHAGVWSTTECDTDSTQVRKVYASVTVWVAQGKLARWETDRRGVNAYSYPCP